MKREILIFILLAIGGVACEKENLSTEFSQNVVVQAYLYAHNSFDSVYVSELLPYGADQDEIQPINDAVVTIRHNDTDYTLEKLEGDGMYSNADNDFQVIAGDQYFLSVAHNDDYSTAETTVPFKPDNIAISDTLIDFEQVAMQMGFGMEMDTTSIEITWDNPNEDYFYVLIESVDSIQESIRIEPDDLGGFGGMRGGMGNMRRILSAPRPIHSYKIMIMTLEYFGNYRVRVYRVNQEYVDLYETQDQDSRNLTEPATNIENGLGVFTAFNSDSVFFTVNKAE